MFVYILNIAI